MQINLINILLLNPQLMLKRTDNLVAIVLKLIIINILMEPFYLIIIKNAFADFSEIPVNNMITQRSNDIRFRTVFRNIESRWGKRVFF